MIALLQRVTGASVTVGDVAVGRIGPGVLALIGVQRGDTVAQATRLLERILGYRMFEDDQGRMNLSLQQVAGGLLLVPQFTLAADTRKGMRASFAPAADSDAGQSLFESLLNLARANHPQVASGRFGAHMQVSLVNEGPVTFWLEVPPPV
ncbi:MAG: D-aminoacyl-tRNA deacylase [Thioalkalivibrio sp.]